MIVQLLTALLIIFYLTIVSRIGDYIAKKYDAYVGRKVTHLLGGGVGLLIMYLFLKSVLVPIIVTATSLAVLIYRRIKSPFAFQLDDDYGEIYFTLMFSLLIPAFWQEKIIAFLSLSTIAYSDALAGLVRRKLYDSRVKAWEGSIVFFFVQLLICLAFGCGVLLSLTIAFICTLVEYQELLNDNIALPLSAVLLLC